MTADHSMYRISKRFSFSASHSLPQLPSDHKCHRLHGHNYTVELVLVSDVLVGGMVRDYAELGAFKDWLMITLDHRHLNDWMTRVGGGDSTAENLARELYVMACDLCGIGDLLAEVTVKETDNTTATFVNSTLR